MKWPIVIVIRTISYREIELWVYRKLVKWKIVKLQPSHMVCPNQTRARKQAEAFMANINRQTFDLTNRYRKGEIGGPVLVTNDDPLFDIVLEGPVLKRLVIPSGKTVEVASPIISLVAYGEYDGDGHRALIPYEWDALAVVEDMIWSLGNGSWFERPISETLKQVKERRGLYVRRKEVSGT